MNRFLIEIHPGRIAKSLCDKHIVKMPLEEAQMLSHALHRYLAKGDEDFATFNKREGLQNGPKNHGKHPCTIWAGDTRANYTYSLAMLEEMCAEYTKRYHRDHKCSLLIPRFKFMAKYIPDGNITPHPQAFKDHPEFMTDERWPITAYRRYYKWKYDTTDWCKLNKLRETPHWLLKPEPEVRNVT